MKNITAILAILMIIFAALACSTDETDKANKLVDEANTAITDGNKGLQDAVTKGKQFDDMVKDAEETKEEQTKINDYGKNELLPLYDKIKENFQKASDKFSEASKLKVDAKYKEYLEAKAAEFKKRAEHAESLKAVPNSLGSSKDKDDYYEKAKKNNDDSLKILKDAEDLAAKAKKIQDENPNIFKK